MWQLSSCFCVFLSLHLVLGGPAANDGLQKPPRFTLNLDLPEEQRWKPILQHWNSSEFRSMAYEILSFGPGGPLLDLVVDKLEQFFPSPYAGEMRGIAEHFQMDVSSVVWLNIFYDVSAGCTSIVAEDSQGSIWHGRNMDYSFASMLRNLTVIVDFQSKGKTLYTTTSFVGQTGAFTGQRPNAFTISFNQRNKGSLAEDMIQILMALITDRTVFTSFQIRDAISRNDTTTFDSAVQRLANQPQTAPNYYIIGGNRTTEGAVITRDRFKAVDVWRLDSSKGRWFVLETNYDHWNPPPKGDDRRDPGNKAMNGTGPAAINLANLYKVLSIDLVCNAGTVYTTLMSAAHPGNYSTVIRHCK